MNNYPFLNAIFHSNERFSKNAFLKDSKRFCNKGGGSEDKTSFLDRMIKLRGRGRG